MARSDEPFTNLGPEADARQLRSFRRFFLRDTDEEGNRADYIVWKKRRPFNNLRLSELKHPWCKRWALNYEPEVNRKASRHGGYYCASRDIPDWCEWPEGMGYGPQDGAPPSNEDIIMIGKPNPASTAVNGVYCRRRKPGAR